MNKEACESFINFCDSMIVDIATEGKIADKIKKAFKKKTVSINSATTCSTIEQVKEEVMYGTPLIRLTGNRTPGIVQIFKKAKTNSYTNTITGSINTANGYTYLGYNQLKDANNDGFGGNATMYKVKTYDNTTYLVRNDYEIAEAVKDR